MTNQNPAMMKLSDLYENLKEYGEVHVTIPMEVEERIRVGIKNRKAKEAKAEGITETDSILEFVSVPSQKFEDAVDLIIRLKDKGVFSAFAFTIPEGI